MTVRTRTVVLLIRLLLTRRGADYTTRACSRPPWPRRPPPIPEGRVGTSTDDGILKIVFLDLALKHADADAEDLGGFRTTALGLLQRDANGFLFHVGHFHARADDQLGLGFAADIGRQVR